MTSFEARNKPRDARSQLEALHAKRVLVMDGAMGTMVQAYE